jgi:LacI family transcriptional regulator
MRQNPANDCSKERMTRETPPARPATGGGKPRSGAKDVARLAGVSTATVSRALSNPQLVDPATRQRVLEAAKKLRYVPHGAARTLRSHRSKMVGAIVPSFDYALYARTTSALQRALDERGYALVLAEHHYELAAETRIAQQLIEHGVDAFMLVGLDHEQALFTLLEDYGRPFVLTWGVDPLRRHPSIGFDNQAATYQAASHLIALGHRQIGLLSAPVEGNDRARARGEGLRAALADHGLTLDPSHIAYAPISLASAEAGMASILQARHRPTAVVATNDVFAVGAMLACRKAGVDIPGEMSITGVDNTDLGATQTPGLTSVSTPIIDIGRCAADQLVARLEGSAWDAFQQFPVELVPRGSTAPPVKKARAAR